jgi:hypothetical protein
VAYYKILKDTSDLDAFFEFFVGKPGGKKPL